MDNGIRVLGAMKPGYDAVLSSSALDFLAELHRAFESRRRELMEARAVLQQKLDQGFVPGFREETAAIRGGDWQVGRIPEDLRDRRVEITGPTDRKMVINALNSGARVFMADFEDANTPSWSNLIEGQMNLTDAIERRIDFVGDNQKVYKLNDEVATLVVRPRGWHLTDKHIQVDGDPIAGGLMDFGLYVFHNAARLLNRHTGPYFYLPKLEGAEEAKLWDDVFSFSEQRLGLEHGTIKATVLIETILGALEMEEILYALRDHVVGLNAGRWDYIFSIIKKFRNHASELLPDRAQVTMTVPFMRAYATHLVQVCHRHGAHAIGGMAAFIPSRRDPAVNQEALAKVREDKEREAGDGFDGTWVAHPDLVPVAKAVFDEYFGDKPNQGGRWSPEQVHRAEDLLDFRVPGGQVTEAGVRNNIQVSLRYLESWLHGTGAVAILNLMEDAATAEIARAQLWQWMHYGAALSDGRKLTAPLVRQMAEEELDRIRQEWRDPDAEARLDGAFAILDQVSFAETLPDFLTTIAYQQLE
ncbi:malate synthase A [Sulfobacillus harzensis]